MRDHCGIKVGSIGIKAGSMWDQSGSWRDQCGINRDHVGISRDHCGIGSIGVVNISARIIISINATIIANIAIITIPVTAIACFFDGRRTSSACHHDDYCACAVTSAVSAPLAAVPAPLAAVQLLRRWLPQLASAMGEA